MSIANKEKLLKQVRRQNAKTELANQQRRQEVLDHIQQLQQQLNETLSIVNRFRNDKESQEFQNAVQSREELKQQIAAAQQRLSYEYTASELNSQLDEAKVQVSSSISQEFKSITSQISLYICFSLSSKRASVASYSLKPRKRYRGI